MKHNTLTWVLALVSALALPLGSLNAKLVAWYSLDESPGSAEVAAENIAGNDAPLIGYDADPTFSLITRGQGSARQNLGRSYLLNKNGGLNLGNSPAVQPTDKFTISMWLQPLTIDPFDRLLESQAGNGNDQDGIRIDTNGNGNQIRVLVRDGNGATNTQLAHPTVLKNDGTWYFVAFRYDSAGVDNAPFQLTVIEAGETPLDEASVTAATVFPAALNTGPLHRPHGSPTLIGLENVNGNPNSLHGSLDEIAFYDNSDGMGVLSDAALADTFNFGPSGVELISSFTTDRENVSPGNPATLSWEVTTPFDSLVLDDGEGNTVDLVPMTTDGSGSTMVNPTASTTYRIRATRGEAANVFILKIISGAAPEIPSFNASIFVIQTGNSANLTWQTIGADSITLDPGATDVSAVNTLEITPTVTTNYTLSATNSFGTTTAEVLVTVLSGKVPAHRYIASSPGNDTGLWQDDIGIRDINLTGILLENPLATPSANTSIAAAYRTDGGISGGTVAAFLDPDLAVELWVRPGTQTEAHQVIFETGGGQNGLGILVTDTNFRFIASAGNVRTLDVTIPTEGLNLDDFIQVVVSSSPAEEVLISVRDTFGNVRTLTETANVARGGNGAGLFVWASGGVDQPEINLGGRTEEPDASPSGLSRFTGELAIVNIYNTTLDEGDIQTLFSLIATTTGVSGLLITEVDYAVPTNQLTITWNSVNGRSYEAQFTTSLREDEWFALAGPFVAEGPSTTQVLTLPPGQKKFFVRVIESNP